MSSISIQVRKQRVYDSLIEDVRRQIHDGSLHVGHYLLPERELATKYSVSSRAVREGLARLEAEGLIRRHQGRGTMVLRPATEPEARQQKNVAVIFQGRVRDNSTAEDFDGLQQAFQREGYGTTLYVADYSPEKETRIVQQLAAEGVPGVVLFSAHPMNSFAHLAAAQKAGMKIAVYDHDFPEFDCNSVGIDDELAAYEATEHLIRLGCRELLFIRYDRNWTTVQARERGFEEAARQWAPELPRRVLSLPENLEPAQFNERLGQELTAIARGSAQRPLGVVVWWDEIALKAMSHLQNAGWSVPQDAKIVGFANDLSGAMADVPLTTLAIPREEIASLVALSLVNQMRDPTRPAQRIRLKARMIVRDSCGTYPTSRAVMAAPPVPSRKSVTLEEALA
jgi:LacI family transcriptional regulator